MSFLTKNEDVFYFSGRDILWKGPINGSEICSDGSCPVRIDINYLPAGKSTADIEIVWNPISKFRRSRGEMVDFDIRITRNGEVAHDDTVDIDIPYEAEDAWDPVFATVGAIAFRVVGGSGLEGAEIGFGSAQGIAFRSPFSGSRFRHMATGWRSLNQPMEPYLTLRIHLGKTNSPLQLSIGRVFVGQNYDPYIYNPAYEYIASKRGRPNILGGDDIRAEFEAQARDACAKHSYVGSQSFIRPFFVERRGDPEFPMLIGSPNSISWYAIDPPHTIEIFKHDGYVVPGDVVFDCGAHAGQMAALFGVVAGPRGKVLAFEPFPQNYFQVEAQARANGLTNLQSMRAGVGSAHDSVNVSIGAQQTTRHDSRGGVLGKAADSIDISIVPLDNFIDLNPTFIKLDVEGAEVSALQGASRVLRNCKPKLFIETHFAIAQFGHTLTDLFEAIPQDIYNIRVSHGGWRDYEPGMEKTIDEQMIVTAFPK